MKQKIKRVWHHYEKWEETHHGMWARPTGMERETWISRCAEFMADTAQFKLAMFRALDEWPISCETHLSAITMNRQAWLGHAACCLQIGCPEECTRTAWWRLTDQQRLMADEAAAEAIMFWEERFMAEKQPLLKRFYA